MGSPEPRRRAKVLGILRDALRQKSMGVIEEIPEKGHRQVREARRRHRVVHSGDQPVRDADRYRDLRDQMQGRAKDGVKVDRLGNVYVSGPRGLWILSLAGRHLGTSRRQNTSQLRVGR
jgi:hypothetical protein